MLSCKTSWVLVAVGSLIATTAWSQEQAGQDQSNRSGASDQSAQAGRHADEQIRQVLMQIAQDPKTAADKLFLLTASLHNNSEMELAKEVMEKSQNPQVKKMAQHMLQQLRKTHEELQKTAQAIGLDLPQELNQAAVQEVQIVAALPADQLDRQYTARAQADNAQDASQYQSEAQIAQDPQVKKFAQEQAQGIQQRTPDANQTARGLGMPGGEEAQPAGGNIPGRSGDNR